MREKKRVEAGDCCVIDCVVFERESEERRF